MGIYIKGVEMPKNCLECVFYRSTSSTYDYCCISTAEPKGYIPEDCPLVEEKTGRWQYVDYGGFGNYHCTACGKICICNGDYDYCPNCGSRMVNNNE